MRSMFRRDCDEIKGVVLGLGLGIKVVDRPPTYATDEASTESVMLHFMKRIPFSRLVTIQATSPLLQAQHLDQALIQFDEGGCDAMLSAVRIKAFFWNDDGTPMNYDPLHRPMQPSVWRHPDGERRLLHFETRNTFPVPLSFRWTHRHLRNARGNCR